MKRIARPAGVPHRRNGERGYVGRGHVLRGKKCALCAKRNARNADTKR